MDSDRLFQEVSLHKAAPIFCNKAQSLKELGSGVKSFIYCMKGRGHLENYPHASLMICFLATLEAAHGSLRSFLSYSFTPMRRPPKQAQKGFPDHFTTAAQSTPLSICFPVSLDLNLHLFVSHGADP